MYDISITVEKCTDINQYLDERYKGHTPSQEGWT